MLAPASHYLLSNEGITRIGVVRTESLDHAHVSGRSKQ
jgi:hypothetical protein